MKYWKLLKKKLAYLDASKAPVISSKFLIDGAEILALPLLLHVASKIIEKIIQIQTQERNEQRTSHWSDPSWPTRSV